MSAINSFAAARASNDANLIQFSGQLVGQYIETLEFEPEAETEENNDDQSEQSS